MLPGWTGDRTYLRFEDCAACERTAWQLGCGSKRELMTPCRQISGLLGKFFFLGGGVAQERDMMDCTPATQKPTDDTGGKRKKPRENVSLNQMTPGWMNPTDVYV